MMALMLQFGLIFMAITPFLLWAAFPFSIVLINLIMAKKATSDISSKESMSEIGFQAITLLVLALICDTSVSELVAFLIYELKYRTLKFKTIFLLISFHTKR